MHIRIGFEISVTCQAPVPMLLALSVHPQFPDRIIGEDKVRAMNGIALTEYLDGFGNRITRAVAPVGTTTFWSDCIVEVSGQPDHVPFGARQHRVEDLPFETLNFLTASRYGDSDKLVDFAWKQFRQTQEGWPRVQAIADFVHTNITFGYQFGRHDKTAYNVLIEKAGVCRDFAHLGVGLCRAMNIPARYVSGYLGDIGVPDAGFDDFCAWFEVFLDGEWHTVDARYNVPRIGRIVMVRGTDASDVAMITSFGNYLLSGFRVWSTEVPQTIAESNLPALLQTIPAPRPKDSLFAVQH